jgi:glycosidase
MARPFAALQAVTAAAFLALGAPAQAAPGQAVFGPDRLPEDDVIYLVMPDRFENGDPSNDKGGKTGDRTQTGFDPTLKGFYHGGDLKGLLSRLDYIQGLGATALWLTPVVANKAYQGEGPNPSAGYHGYWGVNFQDVDPHLGTRADYKALVDAAHARGMKVYFDIVVNHTADVIKYRECADRFCAYRGRAEFPYVRHGGVDGAAINDGFIGDGAAGQTAANFARLTRPDYAYTPFVPEAERDVKAPAWLNDVSLYHNRGESTFKGESSQFGDFAGLDDVMTENPRVVQGFIDLYGAWIGDFGLDGLRIDTARHVNPEFWQAFVPAMLARAKARGIENFHIFGEVMEFEPGLLAKSTLVDRLPAVNDFALQQAIKETVAEGAPTDRLAKVFLGDVLYAGGEATARRLVTLTGNHDVLRLGRTLRAANPKADEAELLKRAILANAILLHARGIPALYYGDEQGFTGEGEGDQPSREDMFPSQVASYNDNRLIGSTVSTAISNFDPRHPLYRAIAEMTRARHDDPALRRGDQVTRLSSSTAGLFAFSRLLAGEGETLVVINTSPEPQSAQVMVETESMRWTSTHGDCAQSASAPGSYRIAVPALSYIVCKAVR